MHEGRPTKQVIVVRRDLKMRRGKEIAQCCHASIAFLSKNLCEDDSTIRHWIRLREAEIEWLQQSFTKIVCQAHSEEQLYELARKADAAGVESHIIIDNGTTEFRGVKTPTCIAIGPDYSDIIDNITGDLLLY